MRRTKHNLSWIAEKKGINVVKRKENGKERSARNFYNIWEKSIFKCHIGIYKCEKFYL